VSRRAVGVLVTRISGQQPIECGQQISFGSRARFHQGQSRRRMGHEHAHQPIAEVGAESFQFPCQVDYARPGSVHIEFDRPHRPIFCPFGAPAGVGQFRPGRESEEGSQGLHEPPETKNGCAMLGARTPGYPFRRADDRRRFRRVLT